eukprot:61479_1
MLIFEQENPSYSPTKISQSPTNYPTQNPTTFPSISPTRFPASNINIIFPVFFRIVYQIHNLTTDNMLIFEQESMKTINSVVEVLEKHYFDIEYGVEYKYFMINVLNINGFSDLSNVYLKSGE